MSDRKEALRRYVERPDAKRLEIGLSAKAAAQLERLAAFGVSGAYPEVEPFYAARLLEQALENLGEDPVEGIQNMPATLSESPVAGEPAPDAMLIGPDGNQARLSDQWSAQTALLVFLRHYG